MDVNKKGPWWPVEAPGVGHILATYSPYDILLAAIEILTRARDAEQEKIDRIKGLQALLNGGAVIPAAAIWAEIEAIRQPVKVI